ncbi:hypothetical protein BK659_25690 [Pseudomonas brassicacearum]|uniref:Uncharacterized protein n=1 Tax=Pseudomonas brassicacearum TaxID=930166 RepID=A0A423GWB4_9PSED|nr:hypothetical protein BK659_25690 [Pseudomonas brassicacearum]
MAFCYEDFWRIWGVLKHFFDSMLKKEPPLILRQIGVADRAAFEVGIFSINMEAERPAPHSPP